MKITNFAGSHIVHLDDEQMTTEENTCINCKFFALDKEVLDEYKRGDHHDDLYGPCRRYPPKLSDAVLRVIWEDSVNARPHHDYVDTAFVELNKPWPHSFPVVIASAWCGEHKSK